MKLSILALVVVLWGCAAEPERTAGGDDMGNFVQATLRDANGDAVQESVLVTSNRDTLTCWPDVQGKIQFPAKKREWVVFQASVGGFVLDAPASSGSLGTAQLEYARSLTGWLAASAEVTIPGVGVAERDGGFFHFPQVPAGRMRLIAQGETVRASTRLEVSQNTLRTPASDSIVLPPMYATQTALRAVPVGDTATCGVDCPVDLWVRANLTDSGIGQDTVPVWMRLVPDTLRFAGDTLPIQGVTNLVVRSNSVAFRIGVLGSNTIPKLRWMTTDSVGPFKLQINAGLPQNQDSVLNPRALKWISVIVMRHTQRKLADSLLLQWLDSAGSLTTQTIRPISRSSWPLQDDACLPLTDGLTSLCTTSDKTVYQRRERWEE